jgi:F-type H+-transporting ATPase subunit delta
MQGASREAAATVEAQLDETLRELPDPSARLGLGESAFALTDLVDRELALRRTLADPAADAAAKVGLVDALFSRQLPEQLVDLVRTMVRLRWSRPIDFADMIESLAASAFFAAAEAAGVLDDVEDELFRFSRILDREPSLHAALASTQLPATRKADLLADLLGGKVHEITLRLVTRAVTAPRGRTLERALDEYVRLAARRRSRIAATVISAIPLTQERQRRLARALGLMYGQQVHLQLEVDRDIVGGVVVRIGDEIIDASVVRKIARARQGLGG